MHLIWKRPDGFHGASPTDFSVVELDGHSRLWLHKKDRDQYPFQISGSWAEHDATVKLNNLVNLIPQDTKAWVAHLENQFNHAMTEDRQEFYRDMEEWLAKIASHAKGDTWEVEILQQALKVTMAKLQASRDPFIKGGAK